jgi:ADP-heptose:LPS heptosyltransferase
MSGRRHSIVTLWKNYFRHIRPLLGPKPARTSLAEMRKARRVILEKRDNIGDFVLSTAFLNEAYKRWDDREVVLVCTSRVESLARLMYPRWRVQVMTLAEGAEHFRGSWREPGALQREVRSWPTADLLVNLRSIRHQNEMLITSWMPAVSKLAVSNRFSYEKGEYIKISDRRVYSRVLPSAEKASPGLCMELVNFRTLVTGLFPEADEANVWPALNFGAEAGKHEASAAAKGALAPDCLILVPFPNGDVRRYPTEKLVEVASALACKFELSVAILGGEKDRPEAEAMVRSLVAPKGTKNLAGTLTLPELVEAIRRSRLVIGVDTGPMHMAIACGVPTVVVLGGGHYGVFGPWGNSRRVRWLTHPMPCFDCNWVCTQAEPYCIRRVASSAIFEAAEAVIGGCR